MSGGRPQRRFAVLRLVTVLGAGVAAFVTARAEPAAGEVIYPRSAAPVGAPAAVPGSGINSTLLLLGAAAAAAGGFYLWRQRQAGTGGLNGAERRLAIAESRSLGNRQYLVVADYGGKKFLLGVCPGRIDLLSPLDGGQPESRS